MLLVKTKNVSFIFMENTLWTFWPIQYQRDMGAREAGKQPSHVVNTRLQCKPEPSATTQKSSRAVRYEGLVRDVAVVGKFNRKILAPLRILALRLTMFC